MGYEQRALARLVVKQIEMDRSISTKKGEARASPDKLKP
jgi:hypothetical protein